MQKIKTPLYLGLAACLSFGLASCEGNRQVEGNDEIATETTTEDTAVVMETGETADEKLEEFRGWLNEKSAKGDTAIRRDWPEVKEKLRLRNAELEKNFDSLSVKSKEEYRQLQARYKQWEKRQEERQQQPLDVKQVKKWQQQLLGEFSDMQKITPANAREAYLTFMGAVRAKRRNWTQNDWDYVDYVYSQLNVRRGQIEGQLNSADNLKIRALQTEYLALEGAADTRSILREQQ